MTMLMDCSARFLMCRPEHFAVSYTINPWMNPKRWARDAGAHAAAEREWAALRGKLVELGAAVELVPPAPGLPDLVFTANAAVVLDRQALLARFRHPQRQREEGHFEAAFRSLQARGLIDGVRKLPPGLVLEGAGDCVWDERRNLFWMGYGPRSDAAATHAVEQQAADAQMGGAALDGGRQRVGRLMNAVMGEPVRARLPLHQLQAHRIAQSRVDLLLRSLEDDREHGDVGDVAEAGKLLQYFLSFERQAVELPDHEVDHVIRVALGVNPLEIPGPSRFALLEVE